jgi:hypothetical protein
MYTFIVNQQTVKEDRHKLYLVLPQYFSAVVIMEYLQKINEELVNIKNAPPPIEYRIGKKILSPYRHIKSPLIKQTMRVVKRMVHFMKYCKKCLVRKHT